MCWLKRRELLKKIKLLSVILLSFLIVGCKEYGEKRVVRLIYADCDKISLYYYDFTKDKPEYSKAEKTNKGIEDTLVEMLSENNYDLKLCKYAVIDKDIINNKSKEIFCALTNAKFSPDIVILAGNVNDNPEKIIETDKSNYPIYNYIYKNGNLDAIIEDSEKMEKNIIINNKFYKKLDRNQSFAMDVINNVTNNGVYKFYSDNKILSAELSGITTFCSVDKNILNINVNALLKSYKGMPSGIESKQKISNMIEDDLEKNIKSLIDDKLICDRFNLLWYRKVKNFEKIKIQVKII